MRAAAAAIALRSRRLRARPGALPALFGALLLAACLLAIAAGAVSVPVAELPRAIADASHPQHAVIAQIRLPRVLAAVAIGAALAVAGTLLQAAVRNPLADPGLLGVTAAAGAAGLVAIVLFPAWPALVPVVAFAGGLVAVALVLGVAFATTRPVGPLRLVLAGVALQSLFFAAIAVVTFLFADRAPAFAGFVVGSLAGTSWGDVAIAGTTAAIGLALALLCVRWLDLLLLDDASAAGVGLPVRRARIAAASIGALLAAGSVSVAGLLAFVGLVVPNAVRIAAGPTHRTLLPLAALAGATLLVLADAFARVAAAPLELPVGALLAVLGAPYFLWLLWKKVA
ncbi:MAG: iron ABC transporter permease [Myxococcota bacterium]|nr:iron ABC transporter permease [Myxococcota bacterium]